MKKITGFVLVRDCQGKAVPIVGRVMYAQPERVDVLFMDGTAWAPPYVVDGVPPPGYERAIACATGAGGEFAFSLPQTSETFVPGGGATRWIITDPITKVSFRGEVTNALPAPIDVRDLVVSYGWEIIPSTSVSLGAVNFRAGVQQFDSGTGAEIVIDIVPPMPNANYTPLTSNTTDDLGDLNYTAYVKAGWTASQFTLRISSAVPSPRTVKVPWVLFG